MAFIDVQQAARKWGLTPRSVQLHCERGHVAGAKRTGHAWQIPAKAAKPARKARAKKSFSDVLSILRAEKTAALSGGLYHRLQIDFTYNTNHMEGSRLTHEQTRWIFETKTIGELSAELPVDDIVETANHFRCVDMVVEGAGAALTERFIKSLHAQLKSGTSDSRRGWFAVGEYKRLENTVGDAGTCAAKKVPLEMKKLLAWYSGAKKTFENLLAFHVRFEAIHPFQDGNGRVGRLILLKECLKYGIVPFVIDEHLRRFYYLGLTEWRRGSRLRLRDTCRSGQDLFLVALRQFGHTALADKLAAQTK